MKMNPFSLRARRPVPLAHLTLNTGNTTAWFTDALDDSTYSELRQMLTQRKGTLPGLKHWGVAFHEHEDGALMTIGGRQSEVAICALATGPHQEAGLWKFICSVNPNTTIDMFQPQQTPWLATVLLPASDRQSLERLAQLHHWQSLLGLALLRHQRERN
jgi:hypothetical protein